MRKDLRKMGKNFSTRGIQHLKVPICFSAVRKGSGANQQLESLLLVLQSPPKRIRKHWQMENFQKH